MARFVVGDDRSQSTLFPERLDEYLGEDNPVRAIDVFVDELDLGKLGFGGVEPEATGRPAYHPATLLKIYVYGYLNRVQSSRRLERECQRNIELVWRFSARGIIFSLVASLGDNQRRAASLCPHGGEA
jgi:transposase